MNSNDVVEHELVKKEEIKIEHDLDKKEEIKFENAFKIDPKIKELWENIPPYVRPAPFTFGNIRHVPIELEKHHAKIVEERSKHPPIVIRKDMTPEERAEAKAKRRRAKWCYPDGSVIIDPIAEAYMQYHGLTEKDWDAERNGPLLSRLMTWNYEYNAFTYPYQYVPVRNRDPTKFIHILMLCHRETYMQFYIRHSELNNSQFDALDFLGFPERLIPLAPPRFWHWIAGAVPQVEWTNDNGEKEVVHVAGFPKYTPNEYALEDHPHEIGLLSNRRYDGSIIDESKGDIRDRGIYLYMCDIFSPVPRHDISHWFIFKFPYPPMRRDPLSNVPKPLSATQPPKKRVKKNDSQNEEEIKKEEI